MLPPCRLIARDHIFKVPLDHSGESGGEINLFVREITSPVAKPHNPYLIYLQGAGSAAPVAPNSSAVALRHYCIGYPVLSCFLEVGMRHCLPNMK